MMQLRKSNQRGHVNHGWLDTHHTFSFANYYDPQHMHFRKLRVINEDRVSAGAGFPAHPHADMEIISYVVDGAIEHKDSMGNRFVLHPGEVQRMSAGTGITHSEFNPSQDEPLHFLQIWILSNEKGLTPSYEQKNYAEQLLPNALRLIASSDAREDSVHIHQDVNLYTARMTEGAVLVYDIPVGRHVWLQLIKGELSVNGQSVRAGDGLAVSQEVSLKIESHGQSELLLFDLA